MSETVRKGAYRMTLRDANQLAAFLNNGWKIVEDEEPAEEIEVQPPMYNKTDINRMKADMVVEVAKEQGIDTEGKTSADLKKLLIEKFGL